MITAYDGAMLWCAAQALNVASMGLFAVRVLARRSPAAAATAAMAAVATIITVTLLAPVRLPELQLASSLIDGAHANGEAVAKSSESIAGRPTRALQLKATSQVQKPLSLSSRPCHTTPARRRPRAAPHGT